MLAQLAIRNIVLIEALDIRFAPGLSVLTGETGAGKSILLDAFGLALGGRGDGGLVRQGEPQGQVTAVFDPPADHPARRIAADAAIEIDGDLILRRVQLADGRTRALVNDQPVSVATLRAIGGTLVEIHGQHADRALLDPASHRSILDAHGGLATDLAMVGQAARTLARLRSEHARRKEEVDAIRREAEYLAHAVAELTELAPEPGEEATLAERRQLMQGAEKIAGDLASAQEAVAGPIATLAGALRTLQRRAGTTAALIERPAAALDSALNALGEAENALDEAIRESAFDPTELERVEERLFRLRAASRKFGVPADGLAAKRAAFEADHAAIEAGEGEVARLAAELAAADASYRAAAERLSATRRKAAGRLESAVARELSPLRLGRARFIVSIDSDPASRDPDGYDRVEFWVETNPGTRPGPLMKTASGGELSRFILALKVALADRGSAPTLVFDEVDTGVGGAVSDAIGQRLARLAGGVQVIAVTHAPQVAARAASHLLIAKAGGVRGRAVSTRVEHLGPEPRREEIARMLAGASVTDEARAAASRLLAAAGS